MIFRDSDSHSDRPSSRACQLDLQDHFRSGCIVTVDHHIQMFCHCLSDGTEDCTVLWQPALWVVHMESCGNYFTFILLSECSLFTSEWQCVCNVVESKDPGGETLLGLSVVLQQGTLELHLPHQDRSQSQHAHLSLSLRLRTSTRFLLILVCWDTGGPKLACLCGDELKRFTPKNHYMSNILQSKSRKFGRNTIFFGDPL